MTKENLDKLLEERCFINGKCGNLLENGRCKEGYLKCPIVNYYECPFSPQYIQ